MKTRLLLLVVMSTVCRPSVALDYLVDFTRIDDLESVRPLVEGCRDYGALEFYRDRLESTENLESMRPALIRNGMGMFNDCPGGIAGAGIAPVEEPEHSSTIP